MSTKSVKSGEFPPVKMIDAFDAEDCEMMLCMPLGPSDFTDNIETDCADCGDRIMHRPTAPVKPRKVCVRCGMISAGVDPEPEFVTTSKAMKEVWDAAKKRNKRKRH